MAYPTLNTNEIYSALYNMIISQEVFDRISGAGDLVDKARVDGGLYGDTKLYYSADALSSSAWGNDSEAANLLALARPTAPECQAIVLDTFRQIRLTLDDYLSKRAWSDEGSFGQFNSVMEGMIGKTKKIYDATTYNAFIGTATSAVGNQSPTALTLTSGKEGEQICEAIANLVSELKDVSTLYNDYGQITKFDESDIHIVWNSKWVNKVKNLELPGLFNKEIVEKVIAKGDVIDAKYFGSINTGTKAAGTGVRSLVEQTIGSNHTFAGQLITTGDTAPAGKSYTEDSKIICKIFVKLPPYMSAFEAGTSFFNARSLTTNRYLTWGHNTLAYLKGYPIITLKSA